jgi:hypothetical protein
LRVGKLQKTSENMLRNVKGRRLKKEFEKEVWKKRGFEKVDLQKKGVLKKREFEKKRFCKVFDKDRSLKIKIFKIRNLGELRFLFISDFFIQIW